MHKDELLEPVKEPEHAFNMGDLAFLLTQGVGLDIKRWPVEIRDVIPGHPYIVKVLETDEYLEVEEEYLMPSTEQPPKENEMSDPVERQYEEFYNFFATIMELEDTSLQNMKHVLLQSERHRYQMHGELKTLKHVLNTKVSEINLSKEDPLPKDDWTW